MILAVVPDFWTIAGIMCQKPRNEGGNVHVQI
jgi:hypothetical protein